MRDASEVSPEVQLNDIDRDVIIFGNSNITSVGKDKLDPVTVAIREEIISKQQDLIFSQIVEDLGKDDLRKEELKKNYLQNRIFPSQELVDKALKNKELQDEIYKIEKQGYRVINEKFKDQFKNLNWLSVQGSDTKNAEIKINDKVVCNLNHETVKNKPFVATLSNGQTQEITSYRRINLPKQLEGDTGSMHAMFAARDANGLAIAAKDAVYFSVHYDANGKLSEVSTPVPIKFAGKGDDAIGYIEKNGRIYTLPVDQGTYKTLMQEVSQNKGLAQDISSQEIEQGSKANKKGKMQRQDPILERYKDKPLPKPPVPSKKPKLSEQDIELEEPEIPLVRKRKTQKQNLNNLPDGSTSDKKNTEQEISSDPSSSTARQWKSATPSPLKDTHQWVKATPSALKERDNSDLKKTQSKRITDLVKKFGIELIEKLDQIRQKVVKFLPAISRNKKEPVELERTAVKYPLKSPSKAQKRNSGLGGV